MSFGKVICIRVFSFDMAIITPPQGIRYHSVTMLTRWCIGGTLFIIGGYDL